MTIWPELIGTALAAGGAAALAVPAGRRLLLGSVDHDWLQAELELDRIEPDGLTVRSKDGSLTRVWELRGASYDARVEAEQQSLLLGRAGLLQEFAPKGLAIRLMAVKRHRSIDVAASWPSSTLQEIGDAEAALFRAAYHVRWYLLATGRSMQALLDAEQTLASRASEYGPAAVPAAERADEACALTSILHGLVSGDYDRRLPRLSRCLSGALPGTDLHCDRKSGVITTHDPDRHLHQVISVVGWPEAVSGRLIADILALPGDIEIAQVCEPWDRDQALLMYKRRQSALRASIFGNPAAAAETDVILSLLSEGSSLWTTQFQVTARATTDSELAELVRAICEVLGAARVLWRVQTQGAAPSWFARLPASVHGKLMPGSRLLAPLNLTDHNIAALWALAHAPVGLGSSQFGAAPVRLFRTPAGQAYAFQFHAEDKPQARGNFLLLAPTGGGKSTLMLYLLSGLAKFAGVRSYLFDSKEGGRYLVEALGGVYQSYEGLALNPLDVGADTPSARQRVYRLLRTLAGELDIGPDEQAALAHAVDLAFQLDPPERTLNALAQFAFAKRTPLRAAFSKWIIDDKGAAGLHSHVFNAPRDSLSGVLDHFMVGINMSEALSDAELGPPVVAHVAMAIGESAARSAKGFVIFVDEAAALLRNAGFRDLVAEMYREVRKQNGCVGLAFQDPAALAGSGIAEAVIENTSTLILLPNAQASAESLAPFRLNAEQLNFVLGRGTGRRQRRALVIKRDAASGLDESAILDVDLTPLGNSLRHFRAGTAANRELEELKSTWGETWRDHL